MPTVDEVRPAAGLAYGAAARAVGAAADGVHDALGDALAVEAGELLDQVVVLQQDGAARTGGLRALVVGDGRARLGGERGTAGRGIGHGAVPPRWAASSAREDQDAQV